MKRNPEKVIKGGVLAEQRQLVQVGNSIYLSMPPEWLEKHHLKAGDYIPVVANSILKVVPVNEI